MHDRRFEKKVTEDNTVTSWQRFVYRGYLQIAAFDVNSVIIDEEEHQGHTLAITTFWDPTEPTATRPLAITDHTGNTSTTYFHTHDLTKNVCELLDVSGEIITSYDYTLFGAVTASNTTTPNPFMFSSEILDPETSLVYYNFRHYNPTDGRWISRDPIEESRWGELFNTSSPLSLLIILDNNIINAKDYLGLLRGDCKKNESWTVKLTGAVIPPADGCSAPDNLIKKANSNNGNKDNPSGLCSFKNCCDIHDYCYSDCSKTQEECDKAFYNCMLSACENKFGIENNLDNLKRKHNRKKTACEKWAGLYYSSVTSFGKSGYENRQKKNCECVKCKE